MPPPDRHATMDLIVHAIPMVADFLVPALMRIAADHPAITFRYRPSIRCADLRAGDAPAIALRAGPRPDAAPLRVQELGKLAFGLYATPEYIARHGLAQAPRDLVRHVLVDHDATSAIAPWEDWLARQAPDARLALRTNDEAALRFAVRSGHCAGFLPFSSLLWNPSLREIITPDPTWTARLWLLSPPDAAMPPAAADATAALARTLARCLG